MLGQIRKSVCVLKAAFFSVSVMRPAPATIISVVVILWCAAVASLPKTIGKMRLYQDEGQFLHSLTKVTSVERLCSSKSQG